MLRDHRIRGLFLLLSFIVVPAFAQAQHTAVVLEFEGRSSAAARRVVVRAAQEQLELVPQRTVERTAADAGVDLASQEGRATVAAQLQISVYLTGVVAGSRRRQQVIVLALDAEGNEIARRETRFPRGARGTRMLGNATDELLAEVITELDRRAEEQRQAELMDDRQEIARIDDEMLDDGEDEEDDEPSAPGAFPLLEAYLGFGGRTRNADINLANGATRIYDAGFFPELSLHVTAHPLTKGGGTLAGVFAQLTGALALGLSSIDERDPMDPNDDVEIGTSVLRWLLALGYLHRLDSGIALGGSLGFGVDSFSLDMNDIMASSSYSHLRLGVLGRIPLIEKTAFDLALQLDGGLRFVLGTGDLAPFFGESAGATGVDLMASLAGALDMGLAYALRLGLIHYFLSFDGDALSPANTALDGSDTAFVVTVSAGWRLD